MPRDCIFVSYSHADAPWLERLEIFLKPFAWGRSHRKGGRLWADPYIQTGKLWRREIADGLERARVAVLLLSANFLASEFIENDELPKLLDGARSGELTLVCVPVGSSLVDLQRPELLEFQWPRPHDQPLDLLSSADRDAALALVFRKLYEVAAASGLTEGEPAATGGPSLAGKEHPLVALSVGGTPARLFGVPAQRPHFIPRPELRKRLRDALLAGTHAAIGLTGVARVGVLGQGGVGKTVSAIDLAHDKELRGTFPDGIHWLTLGQNPNVVSLQAMLIQQLTGMSEAVASVPDGSRRLKALLADRICLLVLDDVWRPEHAWAFDVLGARSRLLATTRDAAVLTSLGALEIKLDVLSEPQAIELIATWTGHAVDSLPPEASALVRRCGYLALAISVAGAMVHDGTGWSDVLAAVEAGNLRFLDHPYASVFACLRLSIDGLPETDRARYLELAVVPEDAPMPVSVIARLWARTGKTEAHRCSQLLADFERKGLVYVEGEGEKMTVHLHDLQRDFLNLAADDVRGLHGRLLDALAEGLEPSPAGAHRTWWSLPVDQQYAWHQLAYHLRCADHLQELRALLLDYDWLRAKLKTTDIQGLLSDFETMGCDEAAGQVQGALRLSAHVLAKDSCQLPSQLCGRLGDVEHPEIQMLLAAVRARKAHGPWLRPLTRSLLPPDGPLTWTLDHWLPVTCVALTPDGRRAVSADQGRTLKVWDLETGALLRTLDLHGHLVADLILFANGRRAMVDTTVWDLENGSIVQAIEHSELPLPHRSVVVSDASIKDLIDITRRIEVRDLSGSSVLKSLAPRIIGQELFLTPDGSCAVMTDGMDSLKVVDLKTGMILGAFTGALAMRYRTVARLYRIVVLPDGRRAMVASSDRMKLWDLRTGVVLRTFNDRSADVHGLALSSDGRLAVSGSSRTVRVWDVESGAVLQVLHGHTASIETVAVTADGGRAISGSADGILKVWDLQRSVSDRTESHREFVGRVQRIAIAPDGTHAVSGGAIPKLWDLETGTLVRAFVSLGGLGEVALTPDGRSALGGSSDNVLKLWDLETGATIRILSGYEYPAAGLAVTTDGRRVVSVARNGTLRIWDLGTGTLLRSRKSNEDDMLDAVVTPDSRQVVCVSQKAGLLDLLTGRPGVLTRRVLDIMTGRIISTVTVRIDELGRISRRRPHHFVLTSDGRRAVCADAGLEVWDAETFAVVRSSDGPQYDVNCIGVSLGGGRAVVAYDDGALRVWDLASVRVVTTYSSDVALRFCAITPDGRTVAIGDVLGRLYFLRLEGV